MKTQFLLSKKEAAEALSVSLRTLDYLINRKQLAVTRIGKRVLIPTESLLRFASPETPKSDAGGPPPVDITGSLSVACTPGPSKENR